MEGHQLKKLGRCGWESNRNPGTDAGARAAGVKQETASRTMRPTGTTVSERSNRDKLGSFLK